MKKILLSLLIVLLGFTIISCGGETYTQIEEYTVNFDFIEGYKWDLITGGFSENSNYTSTDRTIVYSDEITLSDYEYVSYILFWTSSNEYLGYYRIMGLEENLLIELDNVTDNEIELPANTGKIALMIENGVTLTNLINDPSFEDPTLINGDPIPNWENIDKAEPTFDEQYGSQEEYNLMRIDFTGYGDPAYFTYFLDDNIDPFSWYAIHIDFNIAGFTAGVGGLFEVCMGTGTSQYNVTCDKQLAYEYFDTSQSWYSYDYIHYAYNFDNVGDQLIFKKDTPTSNATPDSSIRSVNFYNLSNTFGDDLPSEDFLDTLILLGGSSGIELVDFLTVTASGLRNVSYTNGTDIDEVINDNLFNTLGITQSSTILLILFVIIILTLALMFYKKINFKLISLVVVIEILLGGLLGWYSQWIIMVIGLILLIFAGFKIFKGGRR